MPGIVQIKSDQVLVECNLSCGLPLLVRVPLSYYKGIGARFVVGKREGSPLICILELVHDDPNLTLPLMVTTDLEDAAVDWQSWSKRYNLIMLHKPLGAGDYVVANDKGRSIGRSDYRPSDATARLCTNLIASSALSCPTQNGCTEQYAAL